jgi:hypothetical protein
MERLLVLALFALPVGFGVFVGVRLRRAWLRSTEDTVLTRQAAKILVLGAGIDLAVALAPVPELLTYPVYGHGAMHYPALGRFFAVFAALVSLGCVLPLSIAVIRRRGTARARRLGAAALVVSLAPLPLHLLELWLVGRLFGLHFFWR